MSEIAVVGAGIAGLSAAWDLQQAGHKVTVWESSDLPGGRMADRIVDGICTHTGASIIFSFSKEMMALIEALGIRGDLHDLGAAAAVEVDNGQRRYELRLTPDPAFLLGHPALGLKTKAKLAALLPEMIAAGLTTDPCLMHTAARYDDETVADYVARRVTPEFLETYVEPYFRAPWHWEPEAISRAYLLSLMGHVVTGTEYTFRQGIGHLTRTLASRLDVRLGCRVAEVGEIAQGVRLAVAGPDGIATVTADQAVVAVPGVAVAGLVGGLDPETRAFLATVRYSRGARVYYGLRHREVEETRLWLARGHPSTVSLYHVSRGDRFVPPGHRQPAVIQAELAPFMSERVAAEGGQARLDPYIRPQIRAFHPAIDDDVAAIAEQWWDAMLPEWYPGYATGLAAFLEQQAAAEGRIVLCGDYLSQSHTGGACASGRGAARLLLRRLAG
ncbi:MAG: FAD-dependent oxidoreductase [Dongiaceae bacterium]